MLDRKQIGSLGEDAVCTYIMRHGCEIVERNYHTRNGEIDIISRKGGTLAFIEVKTRKNADFGTPAEFVGARKQERIIKTALEYIADLTEDLNLRFDVAEVYYELSRGEFFVKGINYIANAFEASL